MASIKEIKFSIFYFTIYNCIQRIIPKNLMNIVLKVKNIEFY